MPAQVILIEASAAPLKLRVQRLRDGIREPVCTIPALLALAQAQPDVSQRDAIENPADGHIEEICRGVKVSLRPPVSGSMYIVRRFCCC